MAQHHVPDAQARAFELALCARLNLDPTQISQHGISIETHGDTAQITWEGFALLPYDEVAELFNAAGQPE